MKLFEQTGEFKPDSLIAGNGFPVLKEGIGLKAGQGVLKRGALIIKNENKEGYLAGTASITGSVAGILTDDYDTGESDSGENIPATVYQTGEFNRGAVLVSSEAALDTYENEMKQLGLYLRNVQNY